MRLIRTAVGSAWLLRTVVGSAWLITTVVGGGVRFPLVGRRLGKNGADRDDYARQAGEHDFPPIDHSDS
jgi:hypothetical protein